MIANPIEWRDLRIGVVPADHQDDRVDHYEEVDQAGKFKLAINRCEYAYAQDGRENFQEPREVVMRTDRRPDENSEQDDHVRDEVSRSRHLVSCLVSSCGPLGQFVPLAGSRQLDNLFRRVLHTIRDCEI